MMGEWKQYWHQPKVVLLSGGGNDIAGPELSALLNHSSSGLPMFRISYMDFLFNDYFKRAYETIMSRIWEVDSNIHIITQGYGYARPDGTPVRKFGIPTWIGPWLRPYMTEKGYTDLSTRQKIVNALIDRLNMMLLDLAKNKPNLHHLDFRDEIQKEEWANELHLTNSGYRKISDQYHNLIQDIIHS